MAEYFLFKEWLLDALKEAGALIIIEQLLVVLIIIWLLKCLF
jgi:hypothetical protein